jgi:hypothetical protein
MDSPLQLLLETVARHFPAARIDGTVVRTGIADVDVACEVHQVDPVGPFFAAHLFFRVHGPRLAPTGVFSSITGYESSAEAAIVTGGCHWACTFAPLFHAAHTGQVGGEAEAMDVDVAGTRRHVVVDGIDRVFWLSDPGDSGAHTAATRRRLGGTPWLMPRVLASRTLPALPSDRVTVVGVFVSDIKGNRTLEVKVDGVDHEPSTHLLDDAPPEPPGAMVLLRELAIVLPT